MRLTRQKYSSKNIRQSGCNTKKKIKDALRSRNGRNRRLSAASAKPITIITIQCPQWVRERFNELQMTSNEKNMEDGLGGGKEKPRKISSSKDKSESEYMKSCETAGRGNRRTLFQRIRTSSAGAHAHWPLPLRRPAPLRANQYGSRDVTARREGFQVRALSASMSFLKAKKITEHKRK